MKNSTINYRNANWENVNVKRRQYKLDLTNIIHSAAVKSTDYICRTCHNSIKKSCIPMQAVCNKLHIFLSPNELKKLNRLERVLI